MLLLPVAAARHIEENLMFKTFSEGARRSASEVDHDSVSPGWLASKLRSRKGSIAQQGAPYVLDFRRPQEFRRAHIEGSVNVVVPTLLYRRLQRGSVSASSVIISMDEVRMHRRTPLVLVDEESPSACTSEPSASDTNNNLLISNLVYRRLSEEGYPVAFLQGSLNQFLSEYPEFGACTGTTDPVCSGAEGVAGSLQLAPNWNAFPASSFSASYQSSTTSCVVKMKALRLEETPDTDAPSSSRRVADTGVDHRRSKGPTCRLSKNALSTPTIGLVVPSSCCAPPKNIHNGRTAASLDYKVENSGHFPVEIIPFLYLGNASNAADMDILVKYNIKYIVNVTRNLPNAFEHDDRLKYLQIPIDDNWSQNLAAHFPQAIHFIDEARSKKCGVLVHCLAGISRSVTVTVAYLMHTLALTLDEAYDLVKQHKPNISPNFDFLGQLVEFERHTVAARNGRANPEEQGGNMTGKEVAAPTPTAPTTAVEDRQIGAFHHSALAVGTSS
ncbi:dual specificity protein phosphatase 7 [Trichuris trichiura]|uniref:protein-tyrosine-phosphatase n=1 Tax=Trichuris trichiura TaxID=36087 RepID=A0A077YXS8_TRITR|nr:dual specificity protein phosphatase 7 [Trichuris trichiura]